MTYASFEILQHYIESHGNVAECVRTEFGRREAPSAPSKFVAFGAQKSHRHSLKMGCTQNKSLLGADFGPKK